jgi:hypothetical protein
MVCVFYGRLNCLFLQQIRCQLNHGNAPARAYATSLFALARPSGWRAAQELQFIAAYCNKLQEFSTYCTKLQKISIYCSKLQFIAVYCSLLQFIAVYCRFLQSCSPQEGVSMILSWETARVRRQYIALAQANEDWQQVAASFALEGIVLTDDDAERAGRVLAGDLSLEQSLDEVRAAHLVG